MRDWRAAAVIPNGIGGHSRREATPRRSAGVDDGSQAGSSTRIHRRPQWVKRDSAVQFWRAHSSRGAAAPRAREGLPGRVVGRPVRAAPRGAPDPIRRARAAPRRWAPVAPRRRARAAPRRRAPAAPRRGHRRAPRRAPPGRPAPPGQRGGSTGRQRRHDGRHCRRGRKRHGGSRRHDGHRRSRRQRHRRLRHGRLRHRGHGRQRYGRLGHGRDREPRCDAPDD